MTTDSGLAYLSGLLRAGAEPLSPAARAERRRPSHAARLSDHPEEDNAGRAAHAASRRAAEGDAPAAVEAPEDSEGMVAVKSTEAAGDRHTPAPDVPPGASAVASLPAAVVEGVEQHAHAQIQSRAVPPSSGNARAASMMDGESRTPAASPSATVARETERTAVATEQSPAAAGEGELIPATRKPLDVGRPHATLHGEPNDSAVTDTETASAVEGSARHTSKARTADEALKTADEEAAALGASSLLPAASSVGGASSRRDPSARASQASPEEGSPTFAGDRARASEGGAESADASANSAADPAAFTLEAHVEHLRALMQTARAETPDEEAGTGAIRPPAVAASPRTKPLTTATRPAREQPRAAPRPDFEARPETPTPAANSGQRQPAALVNQEPSGASSGSGTSATEAQPTTPRAAWAQPAGVSPTTARGGGMTPAQSAPVRNAGPRAVTQDSAPAGATTLARVGPAPAREGESTGPAAAAGGGGRAPKLTINRLDVQVVGRHAPPPAPPQPPAPPAAESPPRADPWGALDRQLLGRFSY